eukprot:CAMPEP_0115499358 /NCGR_PEP_ID=MMETSP0271-20121206/67289_1 /TAXON_ID=71861 /ORGANISM="Scrippsiella trochoidea, Strain CCMP3099" /LENGTH=61 /DNA_ID=CAMNT_0002928155 /DNA_START=158 /DNA_END=343 /DNA_ORIENTATION=-
MHVAWAVANCSSEFVRSFFVISRSLSADALASSAAALPAFSSAISLLSAATWSSNDCFSIS